MDVPPIRLKFSIHSAENCKGVRGSAGVIFPTVQAIKIPYPLPDGFSLVEPQESLRQTGRIVEFPDRHISHVLANCRFSEAEGYIAEVIKAIECLPRGQEPKRLDSTNSATNPNLGSSQRFDCYSSGASPASPFAAVGQQKQVETGEEEQGERDQRR